MLVLPKQLYTQIVIATSHWPDSSFQVNPGLLLRLIYGYATAAQRQPDHTAGAGSA